MRLNKFLSSCGITSRRKADGLIRAGRVQVNGEVIKKLGSSIDPDQDEVIVSGRRCQITSPHVYLALNKPAGYVCTHADFRGQKSIFHLLPSKYASLKIAGRLDKNSTGLVLLSNDGDFIYQLTHPKYKHEKEYEVTLGRPLNRNDIGRLQKGVRLEEGTARADKLQLISGNIYRLILHQGWKRQVRKMFEAVGHQVRSLKRVREGRLRITNIPVGKYLIVNRRQII